MPYIHDKIDFTVEVFIVYNNKVLLRKHDKYKLWMSVGGHIELNEDPNEAAIREVKEEVGLEIELYRNPKLPKINSSGCKDIIRPVFMNRHKINNKHEHVTFVFFAKSTNDKIKLSEKEKTDECKWFSFEELENPLYDIKDHIKIYAKSALNAIYE